VLFHHLDRVFKVWENAARKTSAAPPFAKRSAGFSTARNPPRSRRHLPGDDVFIMALDALGYPKDHKEMVDALRHFESLILETGDRLFSSRRFHPSGTRPSACSRWRAGRQDDAGMRRAPIG